MINPFDIIETPRGAAVRLLPMPLPGVHATEEARNFPLDGAYLNLSMLTGDIRMAEVHLSAENLDQLAEQILSYRALHRE